MLSDAKSECLHKATFTVSQVHFHTGHIIKCRFIHKILQIRIIYLFYLKKLNPQQNNPTKPNKTRTKKNKKPKHKTPPHYLEKCIFMSMEPIILEISIQTKIQNIKSCLCYSQRKGRKHVLKLSF